MDEEASSLQVSMNSEFTVKIMHSLAHNHLHALLLILKEELRAMKRHKTQCSQRMRVCIITQSNASKVN